MNLDTKLIRESDDHLKRIEMYKLKILDFKTIDDNKYVASDILTLLLQKSSKSIEIFTLMHGI